MADHFTVCRSANEATVKRFLINHGDAFIDTLALPDTSGDLVINAGDPLSERARLAGPDSWVIVHTTGP